MAGRGRFITFEGGEGAGKSTQIALLAASLKNAGLAVATTREPGGSAGAEEIRKLLVFGEPGRWDATTEAMLHFAARRDHVERVIQPALAEGRWVLCDRFADSTVAYQGYAGGLGRSAIEQLYQIALDGFVPDLTLILDLPVALGLERAASRRDSEDRYERMGAAFHGKLRRGFLEIARAAPERCVVIDAASDVAAVAARIRSKVSERLGLPIA
ncbi:MAG: dTMP kinase [Kiloniellales bacterium]